MDLHTEKRGDVMIVSAPVMLIGIAAREFSIAVSDLIKSAGTNIIINLEKCELLDGEGLGNLILIRLHLDLAKRQLKLASPSGKLQWLIEACRLDTILEIHPDITAAVSAFQNPPQS